MSATKHAGRAALAVFLASLLVSLPALAQAPYNAPPVQPEQQPPAAPQVPAPWVPVTPPMAPPPMAPPPMATPPMAPPMPGVYVELRADSVGVRISEVVGEALVPVCYMPCRTVLPRNRLYVIDGPGIKATSRFMLPDDRSQLTLDVQAGSKVQQMGGAVLLVGGLGAAYMGLLFEGDGAASGTGNHQAGGWFVLGGLAAAAVGVFFLVSAQTKVQSSSGTSFSEAPPAPPRRARRPAVALTARGLEF
jgi:hypothetical protein